MDCSRRRRKAYIMAKFVSFKWILELRPPLKAMIRDEDSYYSNDYFDVAAYVNLRSATEQGQDADTW
ncbi:hypothetical protein Scep_014440 [Stephania cephalantha]|uniref:Uncharacterized protein n=1 Tax=Stephania cephalantha TaxID=152367 RepID=A0AAP0J196_9MAGN